jgi:hypothetical protein
MLIAKGYAVRFKLLERVKLVLPSPNSAMLHDPTGRYWSKNSLLVVPFRKLGGELSRYEGQVRDYLGRSYHAKLGSVEIPPRALSRWETLGPLERLDYRRGGTKAPGGYQHHFNKPRGLWKLIFLFKGRGTAILRRYGRAYRVDLPSNALLDDRGIAFP